jgi:rapamycin-insensitive companion of mTOR
VLGLISSTQEGVKILDNLGWDSVLTPMGTPTGLCVPKDPAIFLSLPPVPSSPVPETSSRNPTDLVIPFPPLDAIDNQIVENVTNITSVVHQKECTRNLLRLKQRHPARFKRKFVWLGMLRCMEQWNYPLPIRRYLFEFFGPRGMIRAVGRVEPNAEESEEAEDSDEDLDEADAERKPVENAGRFDI